MKKIRIKFSGINYDPDNNFIINALRERYDVEISDNPDYLIYSISSTDYLKYKCIRIFYTVENLVPDFNICDYGIGFANLKFEDRYIRYPLYLVDGFKAYSGDDYISDLTRAIHKHENLEKKSEFCSFVYSNSEAAPCRKALFEALCKYKTVNSGGKYLNNIGGSVDNKLNFQQKHKFVIAFENTSTSGYTTEKIVHAFAAGAIPIYWGNPNITREFTKDSFINCHDYGLTEKSEPEIIDKITKRVIEIDQNDEIYQKIVQTPAFTYENNVEIQKREFKRFLFNIFDQPLDKAYRRNRYYWGERYERQQIIGNKFYLICRKMIPLRDFVKRI